MNLQNGIHTGNVKTMPSASRYPHHLEAPLVQIQLKMGYISKGSY